MFLTPEAIEYCKNELQIQNDFEPSETVTANHLLFEQWQQKTKRFKLPKMIFYIIMDETYGASNVKDADGNLGRALKVKPE
jgi:hypothetical protein